LPDGLLSNQKSQFGKILEGTRSKMVDVFYDHLEYFTHIWDILWPIGTFCVHLVYFFRFWYHAPWIIWQPCFWLQTSL
jgi:hypothetical protein